MQREINEIEGDTNRLLGDSNLPEVAGVRLLVLAVLAVADQLESIRYDLQRINDTLRTLAEGK